MSKQLEIKSKPYCITPYFSKPKCVYEQFVNKKWQENYTRFATKESFINKTRAEWNEMKQTPTLVTAYLEKPNLKSPEPKGGIRSFFKPKPKTTTSTKDVSNEILEIPNPEKENNPVSIQSLPNTINRNKPDEYLKENENIRLRRFLSGVKYNDIDQLLNDIKNEKDIIAQLDKVSQAWITYDSYKQEYSSNKIRERQSAVTRHIEGVEKKIEKMKTTFDDILSFKHVPGMNSQLLSITFTKKAEVIKSLLCQIVTLQEMLNSKDFIYNVKKRLKERTIRSDSKLLRGEKDIPRLYCMNSSDVTWEYVFETLIDMQNSNSPTAPFSPDQLMDIAKLIQSNIVVSLEDIQIKQSKAHIEQLISFFPVLYIDRNTTGLFINLCEFLYSAEALEFLLWPQKEQEDITADNSQNKQIIEKSQSLSKGGQPSIVEKFPDIVHVTAEFVKQHSFAAQHRRRNDTNFSSGVTIPEIRNYLLKHIPGLEEHGISLSTTRRLFEAPNYNHLASSRYKKLIKARIGVKDNTYRDFHVDAHYLAARNKSRRELASLFSEDINILSTDDMAKLKVGAPAVSRYHQMKKLYSSNDAPVLSDHDFPTPGYLLNTSGYMFLEDSPTKLQNTINNSDNIDNTEQYTILKDNFMILKREVDTITECLVEQCRSLLNIEMTLEDLILLVKHELNDNYEYYKEKYSDDFKDIENDIKFVLTEKSFKMERKLYVFEAIATIIISKIRLMNLHDNKFIDIMPRMEKIKQGPIYIGYHETEQSIKFFDVAYQKQSLTDYGDILTNVSDKIKFDNLGRPHIFTPNNGPSHVYLRAQRFNGTTIATHVTDLYNIFDTVENRPGLFIISDGGPDFSPKSLLNLLFYYRLFKKLDLDILNVFTYAAGYSAYNCIEHLWAPLSNKLAGVVFPNTLENEHRPPIHQTKITEDQLKEKEKKIFNFAMESLRNGYWSKTEFNGFPVEVSVVQCDEDHLLFNDHERVKGFLKSPLRDIHLFSDIQKEYQEMFRHIDRHHNEATFHRCDNHSCCPEYKSKELESFLSKTKFLLPSPSYDLKHEGHYKTFLDESLSTSHKFRDEGQPSSTEKGLGKCDVCLSFTFSSKTEKDRHKRIFHRRQNPNANIKQMTNAFKCNFVNCEKAFNSLSSLNRHKKSAQHTPRDAKKSGDKRKTNAKQKPSKQKRKSINAWIKHVHFSSSSSSSEGESEDDDEISLCDAVACKIEQSGKKISNWVQCDGCEAWLHTFCIGVDSPKINEQSAFYCEKCSL